MGRKISCTKRRSFVWFHKYGRVSVVPCCYCGKKLSFWDATTEHLIPRSQGGTNKLGNLDISCYKCNQERNKQHQKEVNARRKKERALRKHVGSNW